MILELYSIYDKKLGEFLPPFCCKNEADAIRMCSNLVNHSDSLMLKFPEDYDCNLVGKFDTEQGSLEPCNLQDLANLSQPTIEFKNLVKDQTTKYKDILNKIESVSGVIDNKLMLLSDKINKLDSLPLEYTSKFDNLLDIYNKDLADFKQNVNDGLEESQKHFDLFSQRISDMHTQLNNELKIIEDNYKTVDCPDFLPTNNTKSKKSFLDKLFS